MLTALVQSRRKVKEEANSNLQEFISADNNLISSRAQSGRVQIGLFEVQG